MRNYQPIEPAKRCKNCGKKLGKCNVNYIGYCFDCIKSKKEEEKLEEDDLI